MLFVVGLTMVKLIVAACTPLASDEALYWRYSRHLAAGFIDHPFVNPLMIRLGTSVFGDTPLGVRVCAVLLSLPASLGAGAAPRGSCSRTPPSPGLRSSTSTSPW